MFILEELRDVVRVPPSKFTAPLELALTEELNRKLANKVVLNVGLCICLFDIIKMEDSYIYPGDGSSHTRTTFNFTVFRPAIEEIMEGEVKAVSSEGLQVNVVFFDGIFIKKENMMSDCHYDETEKVWVWNYQGHQLIMAVGNRIRFRVIAEEFVDTTPCGPQLAEEYKAAQLNITLSNSSAAGAGTGTAKPVLINNKDPLGEVHPYTLYGSINGDGLGMVSWWDDDEEEEEADDADENAQQEDVAETMQTEQ
uniref:DNA-directed RNA polymerase III subunit RPC8-like n=1 Tax=Hirondellea gigas TaxID=1518452 RepID=A0A2P2I3S8_9CRUS